MTNPQAFPRSDWNGSDNKPMGFYEDGMTLRDYFAAAVISGILTEQHLESDERILLAELAYDQADAMLKAREK